MIYLATPERFPPGPWRQRAQRMVLKGLGGGVFYGLVIEPRWLETTWIDFPVPGLQPALHGYRIVHLTDVHHNRVTGKKYLRRVVTRANALGPDLIVLTGDYITHSPVRMEGVADWMGHLRAPDGVLATLGNHDYQLPVPKIRQLFLSRGVRLLEDEHVVVYPRQLMGEGLKTHNRPDTPHPQTHAGEDTESPESLIEALWSRAPQASQWRHRWHRWLHTTGLHQRLWREWKDPPAAYFHLDPERHSVIHHPPSETVQPAPCLCVIGVGDLWEGECDVDHALQGAPQGVFRLLLSHNPEVAHLIGQEHRIGLVLSGHTHGGQTWPFHRSPVRQTRARRYLRGMIRSHATNVYVSRGIGSSALHFRWNCRPEITMIRLLRAENGSAVRRPATHHGHRAHPRHE